MLSDHQDKFFSADCRISLILALHSTWQHRLSSTHHHQHSTYQDGKSLHSWVPFFSVAGYLRKRRMPLRTAVSGYESRSLYSYTKPQSLPIRSLFGSPPVSGRNSTWLLARRDDGIPPLAGLACRASLQARRHGRPRSVNHACGRLLELTRDMARASWTGRPVEEITTLNCAWGSSSSTLDRFSQSFMLLSRR